MDRAEIQALIDAAPDGRVGFHQAGRPQVTIPYGLHVLDGPLVVEKRIDLTFNGGTLVLPNGVRGLHVKTGAWGARLRDVCVFGQSQDAAKHGADGILVESYGVEVCDALVRYCGTGLRISGTAQNQTNANAFRGRALSIFDCDLALHLKGGDTNGGCIEALVINACRAGILDESFLGNAFVGVMFHTIREHAYRCTAAANYSTIVGSYVEIDCGSGLPGGFKETIQDGPSSTWLGGGAVPLAPLGTRVGLTSSRLRFGDGLPDGGRVEVTMPAGAAWAALDARRKSAAGVLVDGFRLRWVDLLKQVGLEAIPGVGGGAGLLRPFGWTGTGHAAGFGHMRVNAEPGVPGGYEVPKP